jgi:hypothetical protein
LSGPMASQSETLPIMFEAIMGGVANRSVQVCPRPPESAPPDLNTMDKVTSARFDLGQSLTRAFGGMAPPAG